MDAAHNLFSGTINGDGDCYADFTFLWSDTGLYVGVLFHDDIHNAMNSQYCDAGNLAYDDDGLEICLNHDWVDASTDVSDPYYFGANSYGLQLEKGFGNLNPSEQYGGMWDDDDGSGKGWSTAVYTVTEQQAMGWYSVFTSNDGLDYQYEALFKWSGSLMGNTAKTTGDSLAIDFRVNDNDGAFTAEGILSWSGISPHQGAGGSAAHWVKVKLLP